MRVGIAVLVVGISAVGFGEPASPGAIPGDRLIANLTARLKKEPGNAQIYYLIGRAHYATFSRSVESYFSKKGEVEVFEQDHGLPYFYFLPGNIYPWDSKSAVKDTSDNRRHIAGAINNLRVAVDMTDKPKKAIIVPASSALAHLTLACSFDSGALLASKVKLDGRYRRLNTTNEWRSIAAIEYLLAFRKAIVVDAKRSEQPIFGLQTLVAYEAGRSFLRLNPGAKEANEVREGLDRLVHLPGPSAVTPLILDLTGSKSLDSLLEPSKQVNFDLDGTARPQTYGWVKPTTAFLVWDPFREGKVTSGRQLFGNATWWMLWPNAYSALDALDDNRDGWLTGKELKGLALWYDRNGNGKCDSGEVVLIEQTPIIALRTKFDGRQGLSYVCSEGVLLRDGRGLPTYDWVAAAAQVSKH